MTCPFRTKLLLLFLLSFKFSKANDGAYFTSGNHLIPMYETSISVKKEILTIKRIDKDLLNVIVYYEFYNPGETKIVEVGFEAASPSGDVDATPINGHHPYIKDFTVNMNNQILPYIVSIVSDSIYFKDGKFIERKLTESDGGNYVDFNYVYHFKANFKKGLNIISHTYTFNLSSMVYLNYDFTYILTAAKRWSNKQIDDFTLIVDMGSYEDFNINKYFFESSKEWKIAGVGKMVDSRNPEFLDINTTSVRFFVKEGFIFFQKMNFKPNGELSLFSISPLANIEGNQNFDCKKYSLPFQIKSGLLINKAKDETSLKILRNLPYARRGYIFKSLEIQKFYERMDWYIPDPNYEAELGNLTKEEQEWLKKLMLE